MNECGGIGGDFDFGGGPDGGVSDLRDHLYSGGYRLRPTRAVNRRAKRILLLVAVLAVLVLTAGLVVFG
jgi:hypothetical protein